MYRDTRQKWNLFEHSCPWECQSIYLWTSMWIFFWNFLTFFEKLPSTLIFLYKPYTFIRSGKILLKSFSTPTWISSNYRTFLKYSERQVQNFKFFIFVKMYTNSFTIHPSFLNIFSMIFEFPQGFSEYSSIFFSKLQRILLKTLPFY